MDKVFNGMVSFFISWNLKCAEALLSSNASRKFPSHFLLKLDSIYKSQEMLTINPFQVSQNLCIYGICYELSFNGSQSAQIVINSYHFFLQIPPEPVTVLSSLTVFFLTLSVHFLLVIARSGNPLAVQNLFKVSFSLLCSSDSLALAFVTFHTYLFSKPNPLISSTLI